MKFIYLGLDVSHDNYFLAHVLHAHKVAFGLVEIQSLKVLLKCKCMTEGDAL